MATKTFDIDGTRVIRTSPEPRFYVLTLEDGTVLARASRHGNSTYRARTMTAPGSVERTYHGTLEQWTHEEARAALSYLETPAPEPVATPEPTRAESVVLAALSTDIRGPREVKRRMALSGTPLRTVGRLLDALEEKGLAAFINGLGATGWIITPAGRAALTPKPKGYPVPSLAGSSARPLLYVVTTHQGRKVNVREASPERARERAWWLYAIPSHDIASVTLWTPEGEADREAAAGSKALHAALTAAALIERDVPPADRSRRERHLVTLAQAVRAGTPVVDGPLPTPSTTTSEPVAHPGARTETVLARDLRAGDDVSVTAGVAVPVNTRGIVEYVALDAAYVRVAFLDQGTVLLARTTRVVRFLG